MSFVFWGRLVFYLVLMTAPAFLPAMELYWESSFIVRAMLLVPAAMLLARYGRRLGRWRGIWYSHLIMLALPALFIPLVGISRTLLTYYLTGGYAYLSTWLIFHRRWGKLLYPEPFYYAYILFHLTGFSRISEDMANQSRGYNSILFLLMVLGFAVYAVLIYRFEYISRRGAPKLRESIIAASVISGIALAMALILPPDFVKNLQVMNDLNNIIQPDMKPLNAQGNNMGEPGNLQGNGEQQGQTDGQVYLMSPDGWGKNSQGENGQNQNQYMVMVVSSQRQPLYLADGYYNLIDPVRGFYSDPDFFLNKLTRSQYLESWVNPDPVPSDNRSLVKSTVYSTIADKVSSFDPYQLEPTVYNNTWYPLSYSYRTESLISNISLTGVFPRLPELSDAEKQDLAPYLAVSLTADERKQYEDYLAGIISDGDGYTARVMEILKGYSNFQYQLGFTDDVSIKAISDFLFKTRTGDCTEFSNSAAILGRLAGIPTRVVTGYLVSRDLQSPNHRMALQELQKRYPPLQDEKLSDLYLVTTAHRHSWAQFYLPGYGWTDMEATSYAIPPPANMNPNNMNIVIPDIRERTVVQRNIQIPWGLILQLVLAALVLSAMTAYVIRWGRISALAVTSRRDDERGYKALYRLLLIRLHARSWELKSPDLTPAEYAEDHPELSAFVELYNRMVYGRSSRRSSGDERTAEQRNRLRNEYRRLLSAKRGPLVLLREIFALNDLRYL